MEKGLRRQNTFLGEEWVSKEKKRLREKTQDQVPLFAQALDSRGNSSSAVKNLVAASLVISVGISWSLYKGDTTVTWQLPRA